MISFPSSLNESQAMYGSGKYSGYKASFDTSRLKALNLNLSSPVISELLKEKNINISNYSYYTPYVYEVTSKKASDIPFRENPLMLPFDIISLAKDYEWTYEQPAITSLGVDPKDKQQFLAAMSVSPSMFNPFNGVNVKGITSNVPLLNNVKSSTEYLSQKSNLTSCTIRELCELSKNPNSILGMATYRYADFMYCKDLGKVSNNHLITLRRFAHPVGDHIFELSAPKYVSEQFGFEQEGDVGRLITWFDTDDNKLENIIKYSYRATWKPLTADFQQENSTADDTTSGIVGLLSNTVSGRYSNAMEKGQAGQHNLFMYLAQKLPGGQYFSQGIGKNNKLLENYDQNRVYNPKNTVQETHMYEGKIEFEHEFTLNFSYKLRAYDNINPKSAFLDLIGNILEVTGRRGRFWGGERKLIGPPTDTSMFEKTNALIDKAFDKLGGMWQNLDGMSFNMSSLVGALSNIINKASIKEAYNTLKTEATKYANDITSKGGKEIVIEQAKGLVKNALGRPTMIAWNSLLDGSDVGLWHVTIGNPKNPIMAFGNLIMTNSEVTQFGPLGLDDFPTELKVSVSLKHARPRDITDISKMYTKGMSSIYQPLAPRGLDKYFGTFSGVENNNVTNEYINQHIESQSKDKKQTSTTQGAKELSNQSGVIKELAAQEATYWADTKNINQKKIHIPNPFVEDTLSAKMMQMNNYSSVMAKLSADEII